jgi:uncharacterized repeat protein (TIGR01451 family)/fimbrial isopeptide formation D2 family protein
MTRNTVRRMNWRLWIVCSLWVLINTAPIYADAPAGYSEYFIPGDENLLADIWANIGTAGGVPANGNNARRHTVISVVAWTPNTTVYYDHWEDGYDFDPNNPSTADETYTLTNRGDSRTFESTNIPVNPRGTATYYDGRDRIYVAGGAVSVTRETWIDYVGTVFMSAWEVYPVKPQMTTYILPFGEDLAAAPRNYTSFDRVFTLVQATKDNTTVTVDVNADGTPDNICINRNTPCTQGTQLTLNQGEVFLLDDFALTPQTTPYNTVRTGTVIQGSDTLQVNYVIGDHTDTYQARGFSAFPRGYWDTEYYSPAQSDNGLNYPTNIYIYNPNSSNLTINYQTTSGSGSFIVPGNSTRSFREMTGNYVPNDSGVYLQGSDIFWGVTTIDDAGATHEWGYPLVPSFLLENETYLGWAPGAYPPPIPAGNRDDSGLFITSAQDNTRVFIDYNHDGTVDQTYTLNRLQSQYVYDSNDGDMSNANIWATGPISLAYGQNPDTAPDAAPAVDLGYAVIPGGDFIDRVLTVDKTANPVMVSTTAGAQSTYTLIIDTYHFVVNGIGVVDTLPSGWQYVNNSTTITLADKTTVTGSSANPTISGGGLILTWPSTLLQSMAPNQNITITFTAQITQTFSVGAITRNMVQASGTRTVGTLTQTFNTSAFAFNTYGQLTIGKISTATNPLYPGNQFTYTVTVNNPSATAITDVAIYDPLPAGVSYVSNSGLIRTQGSNLSVGDIFSTQTYNRNDGLIYWAGNWVEISDDGSPTGADVQITGGELLFGGQNNPTGSGISRNVNLSGATTASLSFSYRTSGTLEDSDQVTVQASSNGTTFTTLETFSNDSSGTRNYNITSYIGANTTIRIYVNSGCTRNGEYFYFDNLYISFDRISSASPPNFLNEDVGYRLNAGQIMTLTFDVTVDNPLPTGLTQITNTASVNSNELPLPVSASVTNIVVNPTAQSAEVGDRVWFDRDGDGTLDMGEPGLANVEVTLKDRFGTPIAVTTTDGTGHYLFTGVEPGNGYYIEVTRGLPAGLTQSAPTGHSDNRTNTFNLIAGQSYRDADLGYRAATGTATIGDLVWSDADGDGIRDPGEPGLAGVTVALWRDVDGDGVFEPTGHDAAQPAGFPRTTTTAPDGSYLFTGVTASGTEDYFVYVNLSQSALTGYTLTTRSNALGIMNVTAGSAILDADFGLRNASTTYTIRDHVWFDVNTDQLVNSGETGIAGVTVALLDASLNVIATTTTDVNGYFTFSGVRGGGADYTIQITDTNGILADYFGTTTAAKVGSMAINNLTGNLDYTGNPHFGYGLKGTIGDTVFNDLNGNGSQDAGEAGMGGVAVKLYKDTNGNGRIDDGQTPVTLTTDSNGRYLFSGLVDGNYIVSIETPPTGYTYTTGIDTDPVTSGQQQAATISAGGNALNRDFGYRATTPRSVSGTLWEDTDHDGIIDGSETRFQGVTLDVFQGSTLIMNTTTDASGNYTFNGLTPTTYTIRVTDTNGVLSGYYATYEVTEGLGAGLYNGQESVNLTSGNLSNINFGDNKPIVTLVILSAFQAYPENGQVIVEWQTSAEVGTVGFDLYRWGNASGDFRKLNDHLLPGLIESQQGGTYRYIDAQAIPGQIYTYELVEVENTGEQRHYGPFTVTVAEGRNILATPITAGYDRIPQAMSPAEQARNEAVQLRRSRLDQLQGSARGKRLKLAVTTNGLYYIDAIQIADLMQLPTWMVKALIAIGGLALNSQEQAVAYLPADGNAGIYFYGEGIDSLYTRDNIYWLTIGRGNHIPQVNGQKPDPASAEGVFTDHLHLEEDRMPITALFNNPQDDYWAWDYIYSGYPGMSTRTVKLTIPGPAPAGEAKLLIRLKGGTNTAASPDHHVVVRLNGTQIGEGYWEGTSLYELALPFSQALLRSGDNTIELTGVLDAGVPYSLFYLDAIDVAFQRYYRAVDNELLARGDQNPVMTIAGFTGPDIKVFEVTRPQQPALVTATTIDPSTAGYRVSFSPQTPEAVYLALPLSKARLPNSIVADGFSNLKESAGADYLVITTLGLKYAAQSLADYRGSQGLATMVVELEDIYDEFNAGIPSPEAIKAFLASAYTSWRRPPRYVVFAGAGTYDYKNIQGRGDNLIPPLMVGTPYGLFPSDTRLADVVGSDGTPDIAIGRLPVVTATELYALIEKIKAYESAPDAAWDKQVLMASDNPDEGGNFPVDSDEVATLLPQEYTVNNISLMEFSPDQARQRLLERLNEGVLLFNYLGHAGLDRLATEGIMRSSDVQALTNGERLPIGVFMTCVVGQFAIPGYDSLSEMLVLKNTGGAAAVWAPSGLSENAEAKILNSEFFRALFSKESKRIGDIIVKASRAYARYGRVPFMRDIYNLLGDPALQVKGIDEQTPGIPGDPGQPPDNAIPEPGGLMLWGLGLLIVIMIGRRYHYWLKSYE